MEGSKVTLCERQISLIVVIPVSVWLRINIFLGHLDGGVHG